MLIVVDETFVADLLTSITNNLPNSRAYLQPGRKRNIGVKWYLNVRKRRKKVLK
jgi:hypothetical protein